MLLLCEFAGFWFGTTHLDFGGHQLQAIKIIRGVVTEKAAPKPVFLTGDWNATPKSRTLDAMRYRDPRASFRYGVQHYNESRGRTPF